MFYRHLSRWAADAPSGFIGTDDGTPADPGAYGGVSRGGHARRAMQGLDEAARCDPEPDAVTERGPVLSWERERNGLRPVLPL